MVDFLKKDIEIYKKATENYCPERINYLFILESPPYPKDEVISFFYLVNAPSRNDTLFKLFMRALYNIKYYKGDDKNAFLNRFKNDKYYLIDAVEYLINKDIYGNKLEDDENIRKLEIRKNKEKLLENLNKLKNRNIITRSTKIIIIKKSVFQELYSFLKIEGFNIINKEKVNYPNRYDYSFKKNIRKLVYAKN